MQARACPHCGASQAETFAAICLSCDKLLDAPERSVRPAGAERTLDEEPPFAIAGAEGMTVKELLDDIEAGGRFVTFQRCVSLVLLTFRAPTPVQYVRSQQSAAALGLPHTLISLLAGWWGIPWGPIYTIETLVVNFSGGRDVTRDILEQWQRSCQTAPDEIA
jgi:hypothetical protein